MTVTTLSRKIFYSGDGVTTIFPFPFQVSSPSHVEGLVDGAPQPGTVVLDQSGIGGTFTFDTAPPAGNASNVGIIRTTPLDQPQDYPIGGSFPSSSHEGALDRAALSRQELQEQVERALLAPLSEQGITIPNLDARRGQLWLWDAATGDASLIDPNDILPGTIQASALGALLVQQPTALLMRGVIGVSAYADQIVTVPDLTTLRETILQMSSYGAGLTEQVDAPTARTYLGLTTTGPNTITDVAKSAVDGWMMNCDFEVAQFETVLASVTADGRTPADRWFVAFGETAAGSVARTLHGSDFTFRQRGGKDYALSATWTSAWNGSPTDYPKIYQRMPGVYHIRDNDTWTLHCVVRVSVATNVRLRLHVHPGTGGTGAYDVLGTNVPLNAGEWTLIGQEFDMSGLSGLGSVNPKDSYVEAAVSLFSQGFVGTLDIGFCELYLGNARSNDVSSIPYRAINRNRDAELQRCLAYLEVKASAEANSRLYASGAVTTTTTEAQGYFPYEPKRRIPTITHSSVNTFQVNNIEATAVTFDRVAIDAARLKLEIATPLALGDAVTMAAKTLGSWVVIDAEV